MTTQEAMETIKTAKAEVEWDYPLDYQIAFDAAIEALKKPEIIYCGECRFSMTHTNTKIMHLCKCGLNSDSMWLNVYDDFCSQAERREE